MSAIPKSDLSLVLGAAKNGPAILIFSCLDRKAAIQTAKTCKQAKKVYQLFKQSHRKEIEIKLKEEEHALIKIYGKNLFDVVSLSRIKCLKVMKKPFFYCNLKGFYKDMEKQNVNLVRAQDIGGGLFDIGGLFDLVARVETIKPSGKYLLIFDCRSARIFKVDSFQVSGGCLRETNPLFLKSLMEGLPCYSEGFGITQDQTLIKGKPNIRLVKCKPEKTEKKTT